METNFCLPLRPLESDRLRLDVFDPSVHAHKWISEIAARSDLVTYFSYGPWSTISDFLDWYEPTIETSVSKIWFAMIAKPTHLEEEEQFVGVIGLADTAPEQLSTEMAYIIVFPAFQRTFVLTHAVGLLLHYLLDPAPNGLGFWRIQWAAQVQNERSCRSAERLGFILEGTTRWSSVLRDDKFGEVVDDAWATTIHGATTRCGRQEKVFSMCWDDWKNGKRDLVDDLMKR